jgi:putative Holliday junction resolvase
VALLGIDLGERRIGVALAESPDVPARPLVTLPRRARSSADASALADLIARHGAGELIVGLPLEASGVEGNQAALTLAWVAGIRAALGVRISLRDERLSSHVAEQRLGSMPRGRSGGPPTRAQREAYRSRVDREAAAIILQDELDARSAVQGVVRPPPTTLETNR